jgi:hypothetical protein
VTCPDDERVGPAVPRRPPGHTLAASGQVRVWMAFGINYVAHG